jgi:transposase
MSSRTASPRYRFRVWLSRMSGVSSGGFKTIPGMAQRFVACDREQSFLMPPDVREWLPPRHLAWFVIDAVGEMDLDAFYVAYRVDGRSRPPYDPAMMVALLLYAYARGIRSSRVIERACEEDVAFRVLGPSSVRITRRWRGSSSAIRRRSAACSARC